MVQKIFTSSFTVSKKPEQVFAAINTVRGWWSRGLKGESNKSGAVSCRLVFGVGLRVVRVRHQFA